MNDFAFLVLSVSIAFLVLGALGLVYDRRAAKQDGGR